MGVALPWFRIGCPLTSVVSGFPSSSMAEPFVAYGITALDRFAAIQKPPPLALYYVFVVDRRDPLVLYHYNGT